MKAEVKEHGAIYYSPKHNEILLIRKSVIFLKTWFVETEDTFGHIETVEGLEYICDL